MRQPRETAVMLLSCLSSVPHVVRYPSGAWLGVAARIVGEYDINVAGEFEMHGKMSLWLKGGGGVSTVQVLRKLKPRLLAGISMSPLTAVDAF